MNQIDRDKIQKNIKSLSSELVNLNELAGVLIRTGVIDYEFLERIKNSFSTTREQNQEFFLRYTKRGPKAFGLLVQALKDTGHVSEAKLLSGIDCPDRQCRASISSLESPSEIETSGSSNGSCGHAFSYESPEGSSTSSASSNAGKSESRPLAYVGHDDPKESSEADLTPTWTEQLSPEQILDKLSISKTFFRFENSPIRQAEIYNQGITDHDEAYPMMSRPRGFALIVNNIDFPSNPEASRNGAEVDSENLQKLLEELGFHLTVRHNVTRLELLNFSEGILRKFMDQFVSNPSVDACVVALMSHGTENWIRTSDPGELYWHLYDDIIGRFNNAHCPALFRKPKIFIIQACRGDGRDRGFRRTQTDGRKLSEEYTPSLSGFELKNEDNDPALHPSFEDILICYSTVPGLVANRDVERGTWYIQCFCEAFREHAHNTEVTGVLRKVGQKMRVINSEFGEKQMSSFKNIGFHRELYFNPGLYAATDSVLGTHAFGRPSS